MHKTRVYEYEPFIAEYYDFIPLYAHRADLGFYLDWARRAGGAILELGCGTGRILIQPQLPWPKSKGRPVFQSWGWTYLSGCWRNVGRSSPASPKQCSSASVSSTAE